MLRPPFTTTKRSLALVVLAVCISPAHAAKQRQLWITNSQGNDIQIYDVATLKLIRSFDVGANPHGISATADGRTVHIALEKFKQPIGELLWLDARTGEITYRIDIGKLPNECECTPDGKWIYVPCDDGKWWVIDGEKHEVVTKIDVGGRPHNTMVSPDGKRMYLAPMGNVKKVTIVDAIAGHKVIGEIPFADVTRPLCMTPDERLLFQDVDHLVGFQVADVASRKVIKTVQEKLPAGKESKPTRSHGIAIRPDQRELWNCNVEHGVVHVHEMQSGNYEEIATIPMPGVIYWVTFTPDGKYGFVSVKSAGKVAVVDPQTHQIVTLLDAGKEPKRTQVIDVPE